ncbi:alkaline phosphatase D family protein [Dyadobacter sp. CY345]|uniref:alkaline phosphatase D family protein n=1 Tax=Dyadobacter sp. CY345 TaxID=2909335 RepID=UPI001F3A705F|nr:alkaline phosphatase D family protein [Dyadobacter sp. CY345]MCF2444040.1 alkaline phosphatase D family protein [Dyadobacter sp. CY345]
MKSKNTINRRDFIGKSALGVSGLILSSVLVGSCTDHNIPDPNDPNQNGSFDYGIASFDPTVNSIILWTRVTPSAGTQKVTLSYKLSKDPSFSSVLKTEMIDALAGDDFTVSIDISGLDSNQKYYYNFTIVNTSTVSATGETLTLPKPGERSEVKLAVCSCSSYPAGLFNVYGAMATSEADVILHLGDYIYEYGEGQYGTNDDTATLGRTHLPKNEILTLEDYRTRFKQYRSDPQLQLAHQKKPFICVWDDHEIANDTYKDGAQNHNSGEGSFAERKQNAIKAYHEYIGIRTISDPKIYRTFTFGDIIDLHMLDTRVIGRDKQLSYTDYFNSAGQLDAAAFQKDWLNPTRTILGTEQLGWLGAALNAGKSSWQVLGQQVLMGKMYVPAELLIGITQIVGEATALGSATPATFQKFQALLLALTTIKARFLAKDPSLTTQEIARISTVLPYNLDAWDGYPAEREKVYAMAKGKKLVALSGDSHNGWYSDLTTAGGEKAGKEFATSSVTSPGFEEYLGTNATSLAGFEQALALLVDDLNYVDASRRGYVLTKFTNNQVIAEWRYVSTITTLNTTTTTGHQETITNL